jgi:arylsulfatase
MAVADGAPPRAHEGVPVPPSPGISMLPEFAASGSVHHEALWWCHQGHRAIRMGDWKLTWRAGRRKWELYDLKTDRCEMNDLSAKHPEKVKTLAGKWQEILDGFVKDLAASGNNPGKRRNREPR